MAEFIPATREPDDPLDALPEAAIRQALRLHELAQLGISADDAVRIAETAPQGSLRADAVPLVARAEIGKRGVSSDTGNANPDENSGPTSDTLRYGADEISRAFAENRKAHANLQVDDDAGPEEDRLTSGTLRRGADRIAQDFGDGPVETDGDLAGRGDNGSTEGGPEVAGGVKATDEERARQKSMRKAIEIEEELKRRQSKTQPKARGTLRAPARSGGIVPGMGGVGGDGLRRGFGGGGGGFSPSHRPNRL